MIKLNNDSIIIGQIKQLLHNFNLPKCPIIKDGDNYNYYKGYAIKDTNLYYKELGDVDWQNISFYIINDKYLNVTDNLVIDTKYYDIKTHLYLGKYLRFLRDYYNVNLMSMYNLSINKVVNNNITFSNNEDEPIIWDIKDNDIYIIPLCFDNIRTVDYSIYIQGNAEITLALYNIQNDSFISNNYLKTDNVEVNSSLYYDSKYHKQIYCQSSEYCYNYSLNVINDERLYQYKDNFCLLIKVDKNYDGPLVVLEGKFNANPSGALQLNPNKLNLNIVNSYITNPQLLSNENNKKYLLADRLIEYLTENAITKISEGYDIEKVRQWLTNNVENLNTLNYKTEATENNLNLIPCGGYKGMWSDNMTYDLIQLYYYFINNPNNYNKKYYDFIGYCDSTMEKIMEDLGVHDDNYDYGGIV